MKKYTKKKQNIKGIVEKGTLEEYFYMIPQKVCVRELQEQIHSVKDDQIEVWTELDLMEIMLENDSLIFENMIDTFDDPNDQKFLKENGICAVYAVNYNTKDKSAVKNILMELHQIFGGFMATDTDDLQPTFEITNF